MPSDDLIILGGLALLLYFLRPQQQAAAAATPQAAGPTGNGGTDCGGYGCGGGGSTPATTPSQAPTNQFCTGGQIVREGVCINPYSETPRLGSAVNDATLAMILQQIEASNAAGNWDRSWQLAAQRDAWIKQLGY